MVYRRTARAERVREHSKRKILRAARELFATRGYDATTVQDIVRRARTSVGNLYFYFADKEAVFLAVAQVVFEEQGRRIAAVAADLPGGAERAAVIEYARYRAVERFSPLLVQAIYGSAPGVRAYVTDTIVGRTVAVLTDSAPWLTPEERDLAAVMAFGAAIHLELEANRGRALGDPETRFWVRTRAYLRSTGFPEPDIDRALDSVRRQAPALDQALVWDEAAIWKT